MVAALTEFFRLVGLFPLQGRRPIGNLRSRWDLRPESGRSFGWNPKSMGEHWLGVRVLGRVSKC